MNFEVKARIWIEGDDSIVMGNGRLRLLRAIIDEGSISKAASKLGMSYKKAWNLINSMNESSDQPLVVRQTGGASGGGTQVTEHGLDLRKSFDAVQKKMNDLLERESAKLNPHPPRSGLLEQRHERGAADRAF